MARKNLVFKDLHFQEINYHLLNANNDKELFKAIVNAPFMYKLEVTELSLGIIVLLLVNKQDKTIDRIALSDNELAEGSKQMSAKKFEEIKIPISYHQNIIAKSIKSNKYSSTTDWYFLFTPELSREEARFNQAGGGIGFSAVFPFKARDGGALIFSYYQYQDDMGSAQYDFMKKYTKLAASLL